MHEELSVSETGHSETTDPKDVSNFLIVLSSTTRRWSLPNQRRPVLYSGVTVTFLSRSKQPLLLSQTRMERGVVVAIRSPSGEYFAPVSRSLWRSVCTCFPSAISQTTADLFDDAEMSRVESGEKSTPLMEPLCIRFLNVQTGSNVFVSHKRAFPDAVPAAIHLPSLDTARHCTPSVFIVASCFKFPSSTRHTRTPSPPLTKYSPLAEYVVVHNLTSISISMGGERAAQLST